MSNRVEIDKPAPNFSLKDFEGNEIELFELLEHKNVLLVFNRGFM
jgi:peroxiredoxin